MKKFVCISTEKFCNLILALLGVEGENEGFVNEVFMTVYVISDNMLRIKLTF